MSGTVQSKAGGSLATGGRDAEVWESQKQGGRWVPEGILWAGLSEQEYLVGKGWGCRWDSEGG